MGNSSVAAHQRRYDRWKEESKTWAAPKPGELLPPMPTAAKTTRRRKPKGPVQKQINHEWAYVVLWYEELRRHNPGGGFGPSVIGFEAIVAYRDLFEIEMEPWEVDTLLKLDLVWFKTLPKTAKERDEE